MEVASRGILPSCKVFIRCSGGSRGGARGGPASPLFWVKKEEIDCEQSLSFPSVFLAFLRASVELWSSEQRSREMRGLGGRGKRKRLRWYFLSFRFAAFDTFLIDGSAQFAIRDYFAAKLLLCNRSIVNNSSALLCVGLFVFCEWFTANPINHGMSDESRNSPPSKNCPLPLHSCYCVIRRKLEPLDRAMENFKRSYKFT